MATLTETAYITRRLIKYGSVVLVILLAFRFGYTIFKQRWETSHPPPPPPATLTFGKLPTIPFPEQEEMEYSFRLETVTGSTGEFEPLAAVYLMPEKPASLLALERATDLAQKMDFLFEPRSVGGTIYEWTKDLPFPSKLYVDTVTEHFNYEADWEVRPDLLTQARASSEAESISLVRNWLSSLDKLPDDLASGDAKVTYLKVTGTQMVPALSQSDSQFVRVDLSRAPINDLKVWTPDPEQGVVSVTFIPARFSSSRSVLQVVEAHYNYVSIEYEQSGTYPLITADSAWQKLREGQAYFATRPRDSKIIIRQISLGYYDSLKAGFLMQPMYVFEGDNFVGFVPAVDPEWIQDSQ